MTIEDKGVESARRVGDRSPKVVLSAPEGEEAEQAFGVAFLTEALTQLGLEEIASTRVQLASHSAGTSLADTKVSALGEVGGGLTFTATATVNNTGFTLQLSIPVTKLTESNGVYTARVPVTVTGQFAADGCKTKSVNFTSTATVRGRIDPQKPELFHIGVAPDVSMTFQGNTTARYKYPTDFPSGPVAIGWFGIFVTSSSVATVTIDQATRLTGTAASGMVTVAPTKPGQSALAHAGRSRRELGRYPLAVAGSGRAG